MDREATPSPTSTTARAGSAAASPHTPTGLPPLLRAPCAVACTRCSTAGCQGSFRAASAPSCRSAAIVYWVRSLVPIDTKSQRCRIGAASSAAEGTSTITPLVSRPACAARAAKSAASWAVETIGAMTHTWAVLDRDASAMAASCRASTPGTEASVR